MTDQPGAHVSWDDYVDRIVEMVRRDLEHRIAGVQENAREHIREQDEILRGFPETYATKVDMEKIRDAAVDLQTHLIGRERFETFERNVNDEFGRIANQHADDVKALSDRVAENSGRRMVMIAGATLMSLVLSILIAYSISAAPTTSEISDQIAKESPWAIDKPAVENELRTLQAQVITLRLQLHSMDDKLALVCKIEARERSHGVVC